MNSLPSEHREQSAFILWLDAMGIDLVFSIPNSGRRSVTEMVKLKKEGLKKGVPDLFIAKACGKYHGIFFEFKTAKGRLSKDQISWKKKLQKQGYKVCVCRSAEEAIHEINFYLSIG